VSKPVIDWLYNKSFFIEPYSDVYLMRDQQFVVNQIDRIESYSKTRIPGFNKRYYFNDTILDVNGYIWYELYHVTTLKDKDTINYNAQGQMSKSEKTNYTMELPRLRTHLVINKDPEQYIRDVYAESKKLFNKKSVYERHVSAVMDDQGRWEKRRTVTTIDDYAYVYTGNEVDYFRDHSLPEREQAYIKTFFHPLRDQIWNTIKLITFEPKTLRQQGHSTQFIACLYGPPGTGKSSFAVRVAAATGKSLTTIAKSLFRSKKVLKEFFQDIDSTEMKNSVFVLDEFDHVIDMIMDRESRIKRAEKRKENLVESVMKKIRDEIEDPEEGKKKKRGPVISPYMLHQLEKDDEDTDDVTVNDLLDIIQGPSFDKGLIMFATTNNYKKMRESCPRLFRDGRFKPIYFGYPDQDILNQISQHYYKHDITEDIPIHECKIPTCRILNHVKSLVHLTDPEAQYQEFKEKFRYDLEHYALSECFAQYEECVDTESLGTMSTDTSLKN
jgi:hypothetical protein